MSSGSSSLSSLDHMISLPSSEHLCYVHCNLCNTVLAVSVRSSSLLKTVTVRCGHCSSLLPVNMQELLVPPPPAAATQLRAPHGLHSLSGNTSNPSPDFSLNHHHRPSGAASSNYMAPMSSSRGAGNELPRPPIANRPPEKRQRVPSAYNRFIKDEIQRIKAVNPDISHREAFSAAAKNWAHFPHIRFGLMMDQTAKTTNNMHPHPPQVDTGDNLRMKDGFFTASTNFGVSPS